MKPYGTNRLRMILPVVLILTILCLAAFAGEKGNVKKDITAQTEQSIDAQVKPAAEESAEPFEKAQLKPRTADQVPSRISEKKNQSIPQKSPANSQLTPAQPTPVISPAGIKHPEIQPAPAIWEKGTEIKWQVLSAGGTKGSSANYQMTGTTVQTAVGYGNSASYQLNQGYWQALGGGGILVGDANGDGVIDVGDVVSLINYLYKHGPAPNPLAAGDTNCDGNVDVGDIVFLINYLFKNGPVPSC